MKQVAYIFSDAYLKHETPHGHPERAERLRAINARLKETGIWERLRHISPRKAERDDLVAAHEAHYVNRILDLTPPAYLDGGDTYFSNGTLEAALFAAGAGLTAVDGVSDGLWDRCFCAVRPPGHHAETDRAMGFCVFNNVAVAARYAQRKGYERIFIIDFDVHHGNGTENIFEEDPSVFYFSTHQYPHYPGTGGSSSRGSGAGENFTLNVPMPAGAGDMEYRRAYGELLPGLLEEYNPSMVLVSAGYDMHSRDPLSEINVSTETIRFICESSLKAAPERPWIFFLEGGYDLEGLSDAVAETISVISEL